MRRLPIPVVLFALCALAPRAAAQPCPFTAQFAGYGSACSPSGALPSTMAGLYANAAGGCAVSLTVNPSPDLGTTYFIGSFLVLGFQSASTVLPNGCTLLAFPNVFVGLPFTNALVLPLPPDPSLVGLGAFAQGIVYRQDIFGTTDYFDLTSGTQISIL